jgi:uncharacterized RDD family membrane protein YckC
MKKPTLVYAGRLERTLAYFIDMIALSLPLAFLLALVRSETLAQPIGFFCSLGYFAWFIGSSWQASPGQRLLGMYVVRLDGRALTLRDGVERYLAFFLPQLPIYTSVLTIETAQMLTGLLAMVWVLPILFLEDRAGVHDQLCGTRVVVGKAKGS